MRSHKKYSFWPILFLFSWGLISCQSAPKMAAEGDLLQVESRIRIRNLTTNKSQSVSVDLLGRRSTAELRMEITAVMGIPVATYVMDRAQFACAIYREKVFLEGPATEKTLATALKLPLSPDLLRSIAFDLPLLGSDWRCEKSGDLVSSCSSERRNLQVSWRRQDDGKTVRINHPKFDLQWVFESPSTKVQLKTEAFKLSAPNDFKMKRL